MNNAVIVKLSENMIEKIKIVEPYITWGYPSLRSVHSLVFKYGTFNFGHVLSKF